MLHHAAAGVVGRADEHQLAAAPLLFGHAVPIGQEIGGAVVGVNDFAAGQERRPFVNLIEGIGRHHHRFFRRRRLEQRLHKGKQRFAAAEHRQDFAVGADGQAVVAAREPVGTGLAQLGQAGGKRVFGQAVERAAERFEHKGRRGMFRFADIQRDFAEICRRRDAGNRLAQAGEGIGLEQVKTAVHGAWTEVGKRRRF